MIPIPRLFPILLPVLLAACAVRVEAPPEHALPDRFDQMPAEAAPQALDAWWRAWNDPILTDLIDRGLANNNDLKQAQASLREARAMAAVVDSALYPDLAANAGGQRGKLELRQPRPLPRDTAMVTDYLAGAGDFRLMDRRVVEALVALPERTRFMKGLYAWVGFNSEALPYTPDSRMHGRSHFRPMRLFGLALDGLTAFTTWPLRAVSLLGVLFALLSLVYGAYLVGAYLLVGNAVSGWTTIMTALLFFAGVNLISLGVVGEYVARIFDEVKGRPLYIARQRRGRARAARKARAQ